jgi:hypothetical protein
VVTELRVHGVGGSTPEGVLNDGPAHLVAGDAEAGFYVGPQKDVEAYCWGSLTSGAASRALWLLALPFTLVNASFWMGPRKALNEALVRLLALSLTATVVLAAEGVGTDLMGWQCAGQSACRNRHAFLKFLGPGAMEVPGRRAAVGAVVPLGVLLVLYVIARRTSRFEKVPIHAGHLGAPLEDPTFWNGSQQVDRLRQLHLSVGLVVVGLGLVYPLITWDTGDREVAEKVLLALLWAVMVLASVGVCLPSVVRRQLPGHDGPRWSKGLQITAGLLVLVSLAFALVPARDDWVDHAGRTLPGYREAVELVFVSQLGGVVALTAVVALSRLPGSAARGFAQPVFGALGLLFASVFSSGLTFRVADWLDGGSNPVDAQELQVPIAFQWASVGFAVVITVAVPVLGIVFAVRFGQARAIERQRVRDDYAQPEGFDDRIRQVVRTRALAEQVDHAFAWVGWMTVACIGAAITAMSLTLWYGKSPQSVNGFFRFLTLSGTWMVSGVAAGLVFIGYRSYRQASLRKAVGILWDLGTFWPRGAHPLAPPCYAERCIPDLATRVDYLVQRDGGVILSAHSQGTVLAAALMWQLPRETVAKVRLITYGAPIRRLYGAAYRFWFGEPEVEQLQRRIGEGHWINLWRRTDPIGGPVHGTVDEELRRDPASLDHVAGDPAYARSRGHFDYDFTTEYGAAVARLRATL